MFRDVRKPHLSQIWTQIFVRSYFPLLKQGREVEAKEGELEAFINSINIYQVLWQAMNI